MDLAEGAIIDRYSVVGVIGHGGMASVYHVRHTRLGSDHVLKVLSLPGRGVRERLLLEGQIQAKLKHRNVVEVTDVIDIGGAPGLVMELVKGPSLDDVLMATRLPLDLVEQLVPGILAGVAAAHHEGVVHRDLKPANILLAVKRGRVTPKVADFGLVKIANEDGAKPRTRTGATMGTPQYMAPEQIQSAKDVDARADIFALGAILYELISGRRAFDGESHYEIFQRVVQRTYVPLSEVCPDAPERMVLAVEAALSDAADRPVDPEALWALWREGDESLEAAASRVGEWPEPLVAKLAELAPSVVTMGGDSSVPSNATTDGASSQETYVEDETTHRASAPTLDIEAHTGAIAVPSPVETVAVEPPDRPSRRGPLLLGLAMIASVAGVAAVLVLVLGGALFVSGTPAPPVPVAAPEPVPDPAPEPPTEPEPVPDPAPEPPTEPEPVPDPAPTEPAQPAVPLPVPPPVPAVPKTKPQPTPKPPPEPAAAETVAVRVEGGVPIRLKAADGSLVAVPGSVAPGTYQVMAEFTEAPASAGRITVSAGSPVTIRCIDAMSNCTW